MMRGIIPYSGECERHGACYDLGVQVIVNAGTQ
jgi:hypothetical protein